MAYRALLSCVRRAFATRYAQLSFADDTTEFFSRYGNWAYLVAKARPASLPAFLQAHPISNPLRPIDATASVPHSLGLNWSRVWAMKALRAQAQGPAEQARLDAAIQSHIAHGLADHERYKDDYADYGHWIPQFAVYALTE